jgi:hypothetical protein
MNLLRKPLNLLRIWLGLADPADDHLTPSHGWLLPAAEVVVARRKGAPPAAEVPLP